MINSQLYAEGSDDLAGHIRSTPRALRSTSTGQEATGVTDNDIPLSKEGKETI